MGFPSQEYRVGCHFLLQEIFPTQRSNPHFPRLPHCQAFSNSSAKHLNPLASSSPSHVAHSLTLTLHPQSWGGFCQLASPTRLNSLRTELPQHPAQDWFPPVLVPWLRKQPAWKDNRSGVQSAFGKWKLVGRVAARADAECSRVKGGSVTASKLANWHLRLGKQMLQYPISQTGKWRLCQVKEVV